MKEIFYKTKEAYIQKLNEINETLTQMREMYIEAKKQAEAELQEKEAERKAKENSKSIDERLKESKSNLKVGLCGTLMSSYMAVNGSYLMIKYILNVIQNDNIKSFNYICGISSASVFGAIFTEYFLSVIKYNMELQKELKLKAENEETKSY